MWLLVSASLVSLVEGNIPCCISTCKSCSLSTAMNTSYDGLNFIRELCEVFGDLQPTGTTGVTVLCYAVPRVLMLVKLACGHSLRGKKVFLFHLWHPFHKKKKKMPVWQSRKAFNFQKAINNVNKHCCCAVLRILIGVISAQLFHNFKNAYLCLSVYVLMLLDFISSYSNGKEHIKNSGHPHTNISTPPSPPFFFPHRLGMWLRI